MSILFQDKNHEQKRGSWEDLEWLQEFFAFLQGDPPEEISIGWGKQPKLSKKKAFAIIWYLQERMRVLPENIEMCDNCGELYDAHSEGLYWESKGKHYCGGCDSIVPQNYDRGKR